jgi:hypothetical protein
MANRELRQLFLDGKASPFDRTPNGATLLHVSLPMPYTTCPVLLTGLARMWTDSAFLWRP